MCSVCGGAEADLPTSCPGRKIDQSILEEVGRGSIDFIDGHWYAKRDREILLEIRDAWVRKDVKYLVSLVRTGRIAMQEMLDRGIDVKPL